MSEKIVGYFLKFYDFHFSENYSSIQIVFSLSKITFFK